MGSFLKKTLIFCGILIPLLLMSFWLSVGLNRKLYGNININKNITSLIIGDSHTELAINDSIMTNTLNISTPAEGYIFTYMKLKRILNKNKHIRDIMMGASYHNFSSYYDKYIFEEEPYALISQYIPLMGNKDLFGIISKTPSFQNLAAIFRNSIENITGYRRGYYPYIGGFHVIDNTDSLTSDRITKRINSQYFLNTTLLDPSAINKLYFEKIVEICNAEGICLTLLNTPLYDEYYSKIPPEYIDEYNAIIKNAGVNEVNFSDLKLTADCFLPDGDHLRYKGAIITTQYLVKRLARESNSGPFPKRMNYALIR